MTTQENIKPLVERILNNPLHFKLANSKNGSHNQKSIKSSELLKNSSFIVIRATDTKKGNTINNKDTSITNSELESNSDSKSNKRKKDKKKPSSMAEALIMYAAASSTSNDDHDKETVTSKMNPAETQEMEPSQIEQKEEDESDTKGDDSSTSSDDVFHEAKEYMSSNSESAVQSDSDKEVEDNIEKETEVLNNNPADLHTNDDEDLGEDLGEDIGEDLGGLLGLPTEPEEESSPEVENVIKQEDSEDDADFNLDEQDGEESEESEEDEPMEKRISARKVIKEETPSDEEQGKEEEELIISDSEKRALYDESIEYERTKEENEQLKKFRLDITMRDSIHPKKQAKRETNNQENGITETNNDAEDENNSRNDSDEEDEEELKHKSPSSKKSPTPPTTTSDINDFYKFNEEPADQGSILPSRIVKNWGSELSALKPRGLLNHGVTCYTNAAVQAMLHIPAIQHYLIDILNGEYKDTLKQNSVSEIFAETSRKMWLPNERNKKKINGTGYFDPKRLISRLEDINFSMSEWQQEDSHEYFMSLMSRLQEDSVPPGHKLTESIIYDIFGGLLKQRVTCKSCGEVSTTEQPFYDLSLHLKGKKIASQTSEDSTSTNGKSKESSKSPAKLTPTQDGENGQAVNRRFSIEKSIKDFFNPELIKIDNEHKGYVCEKCHKTTNAIKRNTIMRAPETLLVHLKKFRFNGTSSSKMKQAVSYPMFMDLTEYCDTESVPPGKKLLPVKYQLISVVVHEGRSLSSGHYVAHCKQPDGSWANYDDEYINKMSEKDVLREPNAYYLVYTRLTPKAIKLKNSIEPNGFSSRSSGPNNDENKRKRPLASTNGNSDKHNNNNNKKNKNWKKNKKRRFNKY